MIVFYGFTSLVSNSASIILDRTEPIDRHVPNKTAKHVLNATKQFIIQLYTK